jgi:hypothetical protein
MAPLEGSALTTFTYSGTITTSNGIPTTGFSNGNTLTGSLSFNSAAVVSNGNLGPGDLVGFSFVLPPDSFSMTAPNFLAVGSFSATLSSDASTFTALSFYFEFDPLIPGGADAHGAIFAPNSLGGLDLTYAFVCSGTAVAMAACHFRDYSCGTTAVAIATCPFNIPEVSSTDGAWVAETQVTAAPEPATFLLVWMGMLSATWLRANRTLVMRRNRSTQAEPPAPPQ